MNIFSRILLEAIALFRSCDCAEGDIEHVPEKEPKAKAPAGPKVKLAVVVGHNPVAKGAFSKWIGSEYDFHVIQAKEIAKAALNTNVEVKIFYRKSGLSYSHQIAGMVAGIDEWGADKIVSLHFNANSSATPSGTETLHTGSKGGKALATLVQAAMLDSFALRDRGLKQVARGGRGGTLLWTTKAPCVILEPGFGTNKADSLSMKANWPDFAKRLVSVISSSK